MIYMILIFPIFFQIVVEGVVDGTVSPSVDNRVCSPSSSTPKPVTPSGSTLKRKRVDSVGNGEGTRRTWKQDPIGPVPGVNAMHRLRRLTDVEWMKVVSVDGRYERLTDKEPQDWKKLVERLRVSELSIPRTSTLT